MPTSTPTGKRRCWLTLQRTLPPEKGSPPAEARTEEVSVRVAPDPMRTLGPIMEMGPVTAIQTGSPAAAAGIQPGDFIRALDGKPVDDPMTLPELFRGHRGETVTLDIERSARAEAAPADSRHAQPPRRLRSAPAEGNSLAIPSLGVAYRVGNRVRAVPPGTPAAAAGLRAGDAITTATILPPDAQTMERLQEKFHQPELYQEKMKLGFDDDYQDWPCLIYLLQETLPGTTVELKWLRGEKAESATLTPVVNKGWFNPDRGFVFEPKWVVEKAATAGEALPWGTKKTLDSTLLVFRILQRMVSRKVSARLLGGPVSIFETALYAAKQGMGNLLVFLTLLSANLAVLNFLPIPILDGGHMLFLTWEAIRRKPPDERVQLALTYCGLLLVLALMTWVLLLDFGVISRFGH